MATIGGNRTGEQDCMTSTPQQNADAVALSIGAIASGDRAAFERLYRATSAKLFGICLRVLRERSDAEDVLQEVYAVDLAQGRRNSMPRSPARSPGWR